MIRLDPPVLLVADVHLSAAHPERSALFFAFLRGPARTARTLCILGDLFDVWTGDDDSSPFADAVRRALRDLAAGGVRILLVRGNRDFLLGPRFAAAAGCEVLTADAVAAQIGGRNYLLAHGDHLLDDPHYLRYRRRVRGGVFARAAALLPGAWRMRIARGMRKLSRGGRNAGKNAAGEFMFNYAAAEREMRAADCAVVAHGHFHRRVDERWTGADGAELRRVCLPDWTGECAPGFAAVGADGEWTPRAAE